MRRFTKGAAAVAVAAAAYIPMAAPAAHAATGCWYSTTIISSKALAGNTIGTSRSQGQWCINSTGTTVTSSTWLAGWSETSTPGWTANSDLAHSAGVVSNQGRSYTKNRIYFGTTWLTVQEVVSCPRVAGTTSATDIPGNTCTLF